MYMYKEQKDGDNFLWSGQDGQYKESAKYISNITHGHPCDGKIEGQWLFSHYKYNMWEIANDQQQETQVLLSDIEITAESEQTEIYSDGLVHSNARKGACSTIVSTGQRHYVQTLLLRGEQGKSSYRTELEGIYLGTKIAAKVDQGGTEWTYWTDGMLAIMQCGKQQLSTKDMTAPEANILLAIRHSLKSQGVKGKFNFVRGHQDDNTKFSELAREAKYNLLCDEYATNTVEEDHPSELPYPGSCTMLKLNNEWITSNMQQKIIEAATIQPLAEYTMEKFNWTKEYMMGLTGKR